MERKEWGIVQEAAKGVMWLSAAVCRLDFDTDSSTLDATWCQLVPTTGWDLFTESSAKWNNGWPILQLANGASNQYGLPSTLPVGL